MYRVQLQQFEGPLDLLLFFIKRDELDIYDIPIARIADEFLAYVRLLEKIDLDGVGDFIYMASLLINIKARLLLPSEETDEEGDPIDPRRELVERLLEYVRFKEASEQLDERRARRAEQFVRGDAASEREDAEEDREVEVDATVYDLVASLRNILTAAPDEDEPVHAVDAVQYTIEEQQAYVLEQIMSGSPVSFAALVAQRTKAFIIATFLAVLELARQRELVIRLGASPADFEVVRAAPDARAAETASGDGAQGEAPAPNGSL